MTNERKTGTERGSGPPGSQPTRRSDREDERVRNEGAADSSGDAPLDPADEAFIESSK